MSLGETPWVDDVWTKAHKRLLAHGIPMVWMPSLHSQAPIRVKEYGSGSWGVVSPTGDEGTVVKLTTDRSEASFVALSLTLPRPSSGIVVYDAVFELEGVHHDKKQVFVLWREEAWEIGSRVPFHATPDWAPVFYFLDYANDIHRSIRRYIAQHPGREPYRDALALAFEAYRKRSAPYGLDEFVGLVADSLIYTSKALANTRGLECEHVATALRHYLDLGVLLADVHFNNIGLNANDQWVITDPGHAIFLDKAHWDVGMPTL